MGISEIIAIVTVIVTFVCGIIAKKIPWFNNKLIPIQNLAIGVISGIVYYVITKDLNLAIMSIGLGTGGAYDIISNLNKLMKNED